MTEHPLVLKHVKVHNLKNISLTLKARQLIVFTGVSGSGKSSLAFDTIYIEGQRRYVESLSAFARRYLGELAKPDVELVEGLSPTISIEQKSAGRSPRSTVGTMTEIYDFLRVVFARIGTAHCPESGDPLKPQSKESIIQSIQTEFQECRLIILAPIAKGKKGQFEDELAQYLRKGFTRARIDGQIVSLDEKVVLKENSAHDIDIVIDRLTLSSNETVRLIEAVTVALEIGQGVCTVVNFDENKENLYSMHAYSVRSGLSYPTLEPHDFSFNSPHGMCEQCLGLGQTLDFDLHAVIDPKKSISEDCCSLATSYQTIRYRNIYDNLARLYKFSVDTPWQKLSDSAKKVFLYGTDKKWIRMEFIHPTKKMRWHDYVLWKGVLQEAKERYRQAKSASYKKKMELLFTEQTCAACDGSRLKNYPAATTLAGKRIHHLTGMTIQQLSDFVQGLKLTAQEKKIGKELLQEIVSRLHFLMEVGLHYLTLDRNSPTLSGGEAQRVRLAAQLGSGLVGITYVLDEPSIGLHPRDNSRLIKTLRQLSDSGNTVIVVEHDEETILEADTIVDFGPGAGQKGGEIVVQGSLKTLLEDPNSITGAYLSGRLKIQGPKKPRDLSDQKSLFIKKAAHNNLKGIDVTIPLGGLVAVTGVSGSGKSSLISDILFPALCNQLHRSTHPVGQHEAITGVEFIEKVISIDQTPIGRHPRSNPSTYIKLFDEVRELYSKLPESLAKGFKPGRFSFNVREGSCHHCKGMGMIKIDMDFMEDQWTTCTVCHNKRFDSDTLSIKYKGRSISDILDMTVEEALAFFQPIPSIRHKLQILTDVGLSYMTLGQSSTTLSGGEAQRIKLAKELVRPSQNKTFYILDEPTTGLHFADIQLLLNVLHKLIDHGHTVLIIEHNMDVIKTADWIIDLGPEGGPDGGLLVGEGPVKKIQKMDSATGHALKKAMQAPSLKAKSPSKGTSSKKTESIVVKEASQHNLKSICASIPRDAITVCCGPSGSGKSSFAFDTVYAEGQRRYIDSLSAYARQFVQQMPRPLVTQITGLGPAIAIEQKAHAGNPRSTVGTMTEIYDYLRILYAKAGVPHCPETKEIIRSISKEYVVDKILQYPEGTPLAILAPLTLNKNESFEELKNRLLRLGFLRIRLNRTIFEIDQPIVYDSLRRNQIELVVDRFKVSQSSSSRIFESVATAASIGQNQLLLLHKESAILYNLNFAVESTGKSYPPITPHTFAFNVAEGMCPDCLGLGYQYGADLMHAPELKDLSVAEILLKLWGIKSYRLSSHAKATIALTESYFEKEKIDIHTPFRLLPAGQQSLIMHGSENVVRMKGSSLTFQWLGINTILAKAGKAGQGALKQAVHPFLNEIECYACQGSRLNPLATHVLLQGISLPALCQMPSQEAYHFINSLELTSADTDVLEEVMRQLKSRLTFLSQVGLHYLSLDRKAPTLSNGEAQRIRLARQLGSGLNGVLYVLDEPTTGLHPSDTEQLNQALLKLKKLGNTLLLVEHDPATIAIADYILDFGPGAGELGGQITAQGTLDQILKNPQSLTGLYLSGKRTVELKKKKKEFTSFFGVKRASIHNLKSIDVDFPVNALSCITGVSGCGKSTLLYDVIRPLMQKKLAKEDSSFSHGMEAFENLIVIDQNPVGQTVRSDVCTYVDLLGKLREFFSALPQAKIRGLKPRHFSYNHRSGMCSHCWGMGYKKVYLQFLPPVSITCESCHGLRLNPLSLSVIYQDYNLGQILQMTVDESLKLFHAHPSMVRILKTVIDVGLGYLKLGQETATLSGGEAQRIKLSRFLSKRASKPTLYLLDEPTTGLHSEDIVKLLQVLQALIDKGHTIILVEHQLDVIRLCDWIVDLGPKAGKEGGELLYSGPPQSLKKVKNSLTGQYLFRNI